MRVAIDAGNTRVKWGVHDGTQWTARGALLTADVVGGLAAQVSSWPASASVVACNVAGERVGHAIAAALPATMSLRWLTAGESACGVRNRYDVPARLGADRWAALIGARGVTQQACLVVCAGTATTVDWLDAEGAFRGGLILPGFDLMRAALARNTAQLPLADGVFREEPHNTADAIASGCLHAQAGAVERMAALLAREAPAECLITGGAATFLSPHLNIPFRLAENLILDGLVRFDATP